MAGEKVNAERLQSIVISREARSGLPALWKISPIALYHVWSLSINAKEICTVRLFRNEFVTDRLSFR